MRPRAVEAVVEGGAIRAVGFDDLIRLKRESGRDRDLEDVATLLAARRQSSSSPDPASRQALGLPFVELPSSGYARAMAIKLHRCSNEWVKINAHPCWKVQKALDEQGIEYELVKGPLRPGKRDDLERLSGQRKYPVIEFEDGSVYREESTDMAARIRAGELLDDGAEPAA